MRKKIVAISLLLVVVLSFTACAKEPSAQEIVDGVIESFDNIRTYQFDMDVTLDIAGEDEGETVESTFALGYSGTVDVENRQMRMEMTIKSIWKTQPEMERVTELYLIDGMLYTGLGAPGEEPEWMKEEVPEEWWEESQQMGWGESQIELLEAAQVEVIGSERVGGIDCYVLEVTPYLEQLWQLYNHMTYHEAPDVTEEYLQEIFHSFSVKQWVAKDTYFLTKAEIDIATEFPPEEAGPETTVDITMVLLSYNHNQPVSIVLPPEAEASFSIVNPSFESGNTGWDNLITGNVEYFAPVDGKYYAISKSGADSTSQIINVTIEPGKTYTLTVWARSIYSDDHVEALLGPDDDYPPGNAARVVAEVQLVAGSAPIAAASVDVSPVALPGIPKDEDFWNDDGGNVWIDGGYRHEFAQNHFIQPLNLDPIEDPWQMAPDIEAYKAAQEAQLDGQAVAPIIVEDRKLLFISWVSHKGSENKEYSDIRFIEVTGDGDPNYDWAASGTETERGVVLSHSGDKDPVAFDQHLYYDTDTGRLWMAWGGGRIFISELDPNTGRLISDPPDTEFDTHPEGTHTQVASWDGDEWTYGRRWIEGPTIYKHDGYWYLFATYGLCDNIYSIRMGRGDGPTGPFYDKDGIALTEYDDVEDEYGNSFFLGDDGEHLVPGHAHIWEEDGRCFLGYDYRTEKVSRAVEEPGDFFGIREIHWVDNWPTIWIPIEVTFNANDYPEAIGKKIGIHFKNTGEKNSVLAVDHVSLIIKG